VREGLAANNESSEVYGTIKPGRRVELNRSQAVNAHKLLTIRYLRTGYTIMCYPRNLVRQNKYKRERDELYLKAAHRMWK